MALYRSRVGANFECRILESHPQSIRAACMIDIDGEGHERACFTKPWKGIWQ